MTRGDTTLAWFATAMLLATAPFVARAELDDAGIGPSDPGVDASSPGPPALDGGEGASADASAFVDAGVTTPDPGPRLPSGEPAPAPYLATDAGGCSCRTSPGARVACGLSSGTLVLVGLMASRRRRR